ncbi:MAG: tetratricopeptide repeat protein [Deltaproteobacteria bacterium]|nr:tetratricopeptide repeat protein [Deltaproteobacteria bacterium]
MKKVLDLLIHLEDHKHDGLGRLFLDPGDEREMRRSLREYLGAKVTVKSTVVEGQRLRVRVELPDFQAESDNLVRLARDLAGRARPGAALGQLEEALKIFPLNGAALKGIGRVCYGRGDFAGATAFFVRANEVLREDGEALKALGAIALNEGREPSALAYYERAAAANPKDDAAREALERLRDRMTQKFRTPDASSGPSDPPPRRSR